jgi:arabinoxylan arabinofuranohydrolase
MNPEKIFNKAIATLIGMAAVFFMVFADNPILSHRFTADPNAMAFNGRVYVFCSNDDDNNGSYGLSSYILLSSDDMVNWTDHGEIDLKCFRVGRV